MSKVINIGGRLHCTEQGNVLTGANEILDDTKGKKQNVINSETDAELLRLEQSKQDNLTFDNAPTENSNNPVKSGGVYAADKALSDAIEAILLLIPSAATVLNQLADKAFVNSSVSTATATFRGTYNVVTDLELAYDATHEQIAAKLGTIISTADNNDYSFVQIPVSATSTDIRRTERYKYNGTAWAFEYDLNTSGFTAAQWEAINSGITALLVLKLSELPTATELATALAGKQATLTFDNVPTSGSDNPVKSGGIFDALATKQGTLTFDDAPAENSNNPVKSGGIYTAIKTVADALTLYANSTDAKIPSAASSANKLVDTDAMSLFVASAIGQLDSTFNFTSIDGHITLHIVQVDGVITSVQVQGTDIASAAALTLKASQADLTALTSRVTIAEGNITSLGTRMTSAETNISNLQQLYNNLQQSKPVPLTALPQSGQEQGIIYRLAGSSSYSDYMWNGSSWVLMATYNNAIDDTPTAGSDNLVKSGGVAPIMTIMNDVLITKGKAYNTNTGLYVNDPDMFCSPMLKLSDINPNYLTEGIQFISGDLSTFTQTYACITWFDSTKTKITDTSVGSFRASAPIQASIIPSNAVYAIFNSAKSVFGANTPVVFKGYGLSSQQQINTEFSTNIQNNTSKIADIEKGLSVSYEIRIGGFGDTGTITNVSDTNYCFAKVEAGQKLKIKTLSDHGIFLCVCKSDNHAVIGQTLDMSTENGFTGRISVAQNVEVELTLPSDAAYIAFTNIYQNVRWRPKSVTVDGFDVLLTLKGSVVKAAEQLNGLYLWKGTLAEYNAIATKDNNTVYFITEG